MAGFPTHPKQQKTLAHLKDELPLCTQGIRMGGRRQSFRMYVNIYLELLKNN